MSSRNSTTRDYRHMIVTAAGTSGSRILGMVRDLLLAAFFGTSGVAAAFLLAFQLPNLFRRLLGEGALTTALIPPITDELRAGGNAAAFSFFNLVIRRVFPWMLAIVLIIVAAALGISWLNDAQLQQLANFFGADGNAERNRLSLQLIAFTMPYMPMICLAAIFSAGLNVFGKFNVTSLTAIWLNVTMIAAMLLAGYVFRLSPEACAWWLCVGILAGGALQLGVPVIAIARLGWRPTGTRFGNTDFLNTDFTDSNTDFTDYFEKGVPAENVPANEFSKKGVPAESVPAGEAAPKKSVKSDSKSVKSVFEKKQSPVPAAVPANHAHSWSVLKSMFFPALIGAGITQFNIFFTRLIAFGVDDQALSIYHYANRLVEIPTGIFSASIFTVVYPLFASYAARDDFDGLRREFAHGMRLVFAVIVPAVVGIIVLAQPLVQIFFEHGRFTSADTLATVPVVCIFTLAVPFYSIAGIVLKCLNAMEDARPQRNSAIVAFVANCVCVVAFTMIFGWGVRGLALANLISAIAQAGALCFWLIRRERGFLTGTLILPLFKAIFASVLMGAGTFFLWQIVHENWLFDGNVRDHWRSILCALAIVVPAACVFYAALMTLLRYQEIAELFQLFRKKIFKH